MSFSLFLEPPSLLIIRERRIASLRSPPVPQSPFFPLCSALYQHMCRKTWVGEKDRVNVFSTDLLPFNSPCGKVPGSLT